MGSRSTDKSMISRTCWKLTLWLASALEGTEREAVIGDLAEFGESGGRAIGSVLGLVVRRQATALKDLHLWLVLFIIVLPLSFLLCTVAQKAAGEGAVYTWMYANNWDWGLTKNVGFWYVMGGAAIQLFLDWLMVACWSWSAGFLLGCFRKTVQPTAHVAFLLLLAAFQIANAPQHWFHFWMVLSGVPPLPAVDPNAPVTAIDFYRVVFPFVVLDALIAMPAIWGMRQQQTSVPRSLRLVLVFGASLSVMTLLFRVPPGLGFLLGQSGRQWVWQHRLPLLAYWPVLYMATVHLGCFGHRKMGIVRN